MKFLFLFLDGIGLSQPNPEINPFAKAEMPFLKSMLGGKSLTIDAAPFEGEQASLLAIDPNLGVKGLPQSATGQAVLVTGINIPAQLGYHYGPKPNPEVAEFLNGHTIFSRVTQAGKKAALLNAYPPRYFGGIESGKRLYSSIPLAVTNAGLSLFTHEDYLAQKALSADFTGAGWRDFLGFPSAPFYEPRPAGRKLGELAKQYDFAFFEYWASDYAGHKQDMKSAVEQMEIFDGVLQGLVESWNHEDGLIMLTSDHGNMEDLSTRKHTAAPVPCLLIGSLEARQAFGQGLNDLAGVAPRIIQFILGSEGQN